MIRIAAFCAQGKERKRFNAEETEFSGRHGEISSGARRHAGPNLPSANEFSNCANGDSGHGATQVAFEVHGDVGR